MKELGIAQIAWNPATQRVCAHSRNHDLSPDLIAEAYAILLKEALELASTVTQVEIAQDIRAFVQDNIATLLGESCGN